MLVQTLSCMGGFRCVKRDSCQHYHERTDATPFERLCAKDTFNFYRPMRRNSSTATFFLTPERKEGACQP